MKEEKYKEECEMLDREINYSSTVKQTYDEKYNMYMKLKKSVLTEMLIEANNLIDTLTKGSTEIIFDVDQSELIQEETN